MKRLFISFLVLTFALIGLTGCSSSEDETPTAGTENPSETVEQKEPEVSVIVDIKSIADKTQAEVKAILGEPVSTEDGKWRYYGTDEWIPNCPEVTYPNGISVKFVEDKAARITIIPTSKIKYVEDDSILPVIGIEPIDIDYISGPTSTVYGNIPEVYEVSIFKTDNNTIDYIYVITSEVYK